MSRKKGINASDLQRLAYTADSVKDGVRQISSELPDIVFCASTES
ncbi:hypothetical protein MHH52_03405 [Paenibacillus sp. FSL K6-0276]